MKYRKGKLPSTPAIDMGSDLKDPAQSSDEDESDDSIPNLANSSGTNDQIVKHLTKTTCMDRRSTCLKKHLFKKRPSPHPD